MEVPANRVGAAWTVDAVVEVLLTCEAGVARAAEAVKAVHNWKTTSRTDSYISAFPATQSAGVITIC